MSFAMDARIIHNLIRGEIYIKFKTAIWNNDEVGFWT